MLEVAVCASPRDLFGLGLVFATGIVVLGGLQLLLQFFALLLQHGKLGGIGRGGPWLRAGLAPPVVGEIGPTTLALPEW